MKLNPWRWGAGAVIAITLLAACDGKNLFDQGGFPGGGNGGGASADSTGPSITIAAPTTNYSVPLNDSVRVDATIVDPTGIKSVTIRGESIRQLSFGQTQIVPRFQAETITYTQAPDSITLPGYLKAITDSISEPVDIIVVATDTLGNATTARRTILVGGPKVSIIEPGLPTSPVGPGQTLRIRVRGVDQTSGIDSIHIAVRGAQSADFPFLVNSKDTTVTANYTVGAALGTISITAIVKNGGNQFGRDSVTVSVISSVAADSVAPRVRIADVVAHDRVELGDTIAVAIEARDSASGLRRVGVTVIAQAKRRADEPATPTVILTDTIYKDSIASGSGIGGLWIDTMRFTLAGAGFTEANLIKLSRDMVLSVHAFAVDTMGNCGASVSSTATSLPCDSIMPPSAPRKFFVARSSVPLASTVTVVTGFARPLINPGDNIADVLVDNNPARPRLFMSNLSRNRLEWLDIVNPNNPLQTISVGSEPWGMFLANAPGSDGRLGTPDDNPDRLIVGNSGGTNLSFVNLTTLREEPTERILTPNAVLIDVAKSTTVNNTNYLVTYHDFSDRPQFVAQDSNGVYLYSTRPTGAAPDGTVRYLQPTPAGTRKYESMILYTRDAITPVDDNWAIANIDSITGGITLWDHVPGDPSAVYSATHPNLDSAIVRLKVGPTSGARLNGGSDIAAASSGRWNIDAVGLSDTTYVAASGDRGYVAFGEGQTGPFASVWLWRSGTPPSTLGTLSDNLTVADLIGNASERVVGIGLNYDGSIGASRGAQSASFFSNNVAAAGDLRLQGVFTNGINGGNGGIALHPSHNSAFTCDEQSLSFVATANRSIKIVDTFHFRERGEIPIRDNIVSPLRAALPLAGDNPPAVIGTPDEILVKLYGVRANDGVKSGKAVIINVRRKDLVSMSGPGNTCQ
ncbi:MAG TPA: hypothetical protein VF021_06330 [Longimicrobiales bacterium]